MSACLGRNTVTSGLFWDAVIKFSEFFSDVHTYRWLQETQMLVPGIQGRSNECCFACEG